LARVDIELNLSRILGHEDMETMDVYAELARMEEPEARNAANISDRFGSVAKPKIVRMRTGTDGD
jgi:hypothetical protein